MLWDGHLGYRSYYSSIIKENADVIQFAFSSNNVRAGISISMSKNNKHNNVFVVTPTKNNIVGVSENPEIISVENEFKYCFTVASGYFIARRNGKIFITGNCGMQVTGFVGELDFEKLDRVIREHVPSGAGIGGIRENTHFLADETLIQSMKFNVNDIEYAMRQLGTLGGGNHFIEINVDDEGRYYLVIHSGSRYLGVQVAKYYHQKALDTKHRKMVVERQNGIEELKKQGRQKEIQEYIKSFKFEDVPNDLAYVEGDDFDAYIHDMKIAQEYALINREVMTKVIMGAMGWEETFGFTSVHNYIDTDYMIMRKGAVSARKGERLIIPINMRDGSLICIGKGNQDWNYSAPHGAGRNFGRGEMRRAFESGKFTMDDFHNSMSGIYTTSVGEDTVDESAFAYKSIDYLLRNIEDTVDVVAHIKPVYNFKAGN